MKFGPLEFRFSGAKSGLQNPSSWLMDWLGAGKSATGLDIHETTAMQTVAVYACVKVLAETMATLPLPIYRNLDGGGKARAPEHPLYSILHDAPNPEMTSVDFRATMMTHLMLWGNAYAEIERDQANRPIALWPLRPDRMQIWRSLDTGYQLEYWYSLYTGGTAVLAPEQVLHIKNLSIDGIRGLSPIAHQREAVALTMALETYAARFFGNDSAPGGFLSHPGKLSEEARARIKNAWESSHRGLDNAHRMAVLEEGISFSSVGIPPDEAQFIQSRQYQLGDIARMYRVPLHLIGDLGRVTHANIEHMGIDYVTHTIRPICVMWEQSMTQKLLAPAERSTFFPEFNVDALLRGDLASRYAAYAIGKQWGFLNTDEIRDKENLNPLPDGLGQVYLTPLNMIASGSEPVPPVEDTPPEDDVPPDDEGSRMKLSPRWLRHEYDTLVRIERERVLQSAEKLLAKGDLRGFGRFLDEFYGEKLPAIFQDRLLPVFGEHPSDYARDYVANLAQRHAQTSQKALRDGLAGQNGHSLDAVKAVLGVWDGSRSLAVVKSERFALRQMGEMMDDMPDEPDGDETSPADIAKAVGDAIASAILAAKPDPAHVSVEVHAPDPVVVPAPLVTIEGATINVDTPDVTVQAPDVVNNIDIQPAQANVTVEGDTVNVQPAAVTIPVTVEGDTVTNQVQQPDVTIMPAEVTVNVAAPEPSRGVQILRDSSGEVIGTAPRKAEEPKQEAKKPKAKK